MAVWKIQSDDLVTDSSMSDGALHPITQALLRMRGIETQEAMQTFFSPDYVRDLYDPHLFVQMKKVIKKIIEIRDSGKRVGVFGDFDVDGVTSSALLRAVLESLGIPVSIYIPDKNTEGHGLHLNALKVFSEDGVSLIMTTDCGMTNITEVDAANDLGMEVIIVDHHHVPEELPKAFAIINAQMKDSGYPFKGLCAVGTVFKVAQALYAAVAPDKIDQLKWFLDLAAVGTVADCMPLVDENRVMVKYGLIVLSKTKRVGFQAMFEVGRIPIDTQKAPDSRTIGFQIAPRINAAGRMAHAKTAHELLMSHDVREAQSLALEIEANNVARQKISTKTTDQVREVAKTKFADKKFIFAVDESYPLGIVGLVAGRIANEFNKPTAVLQKGELVTQGSFRSIPLINIIDAIEECGELLEKFGGHAQAAGLTIKNENIEAFYEKLNGIIEKQLEGIAVEPEILIDIKLSPFHIVPKLVQEIQSLAPFGEGNKEPVFLLENMTITNFRFVGSGEKHIKLSLQSEDAMQRPFDGIGFNLGERFPDLSIGQVIDVVFQLEENVWNGRTTTQLKLIDLAVKDSIHTI